jgi:hypothetical protein
MSGHKTAGDRLGYRCRIRADYALPPTDSHPPTVWVTEKALRIATFDWLSEVFAPDDRASAMEQIAAATDQPSLDPVNASRDLKVAQTRIARVVDAIENGTFALDEVEERLRKHREKRDRAKAVIASAQGPAGPLDPQVIGDLFNRLGGTGCTRRPAHHGRAAGDLRGG